MKMEIDLEVGGMPDFRNAKRGDEKAEGPNHQPLQFSPGQVAVACSP
jgi:hypothetical protein